MRGPLPRPGRSRSVTTPGVAPKSLSSQRPDSGVRAKNRSSTSCHTVSNPSTLVRTRTSAWRAARRGGVEQDLQITRGDDADVDPPDRMPVGRKSVRQCLHGGPLPFRGVGRTVEKQCGGEQVAAAAGREPSGARKVVELRQPAATGRCGAAARGQYAPRAASYRPQAQPSRRGAAGRCPPDGPSRPAARPGERSSRPRRGSVRAEASAGHGRRRAESRSGPRRLHRAAP